MKDARRLPHGSRKKKSLPICTKTMQCSSIMTPLRTSRVAASDQAESPFRSRALANSQSPKHSLIKRKLFTLHDPDLLELRVIRLPAGQAGINQNIKISLCNRRGNFE